MGLAVFIWQGIGLNGRRQYGIDTAIDDAALRQALQYREVLLAQWLRLPVWVSQLVIRPTPRLAGHEVSEWLHQLATLLRAGVPLVQSLTLTASETSQRRFGTIITQVRDEVQSGTPLSVALAMHPRVFNERICALVRAGEQASTLETLLGQVAEYEARAQHIRRQVQAVLRYPVIVLAVALLVSMAMVIFVVPRFAAMFAGFDANLPALTQSVVALSAWLRAHGGVVALMLIGLGLALVGIIARIPAARAARDALLLRLPIIGPILAGAATAQFTRTLAIMTRAGLPMTEALPSIARTLNNTLYYRAVMQINEALRQGQSLEQAIAASQRLPSRVQQMIAVGEEAGELDDMLNHIASIEDNQVNRAVDNLGKAMEPLIMVSLGLMIGGLVLAMYLPVFQMGTAV